MLADNEIELKVQNSRLLSLKREFRSLNRALKKLTLTPELERLLAAEIVEYERIVEKSK